jgi:uncharacterized membrane protein YeaQ/YmgE (transglycosylase-associated protein family)
MSWIAWIVVGIIAGLLAKMAMPGSANEPGGWIGTALLGIVGAVVGGWASSLLFGGGGASGINIPSIIVAFIGSCIVIGLLRLFSRNTSMN